MRAAAKGEVATLASGNVKTFGIDVTRGVVVCRANQGDDQIAATKVVAVQTQAGAHSATGVLHRAVVAQHLAQGAWHLLCLRRHGRPLSRMRQEREQTVAKQVSRGFVPGKKHHCTLGEQLAVGLNEAHGLGSCQTADQAIAQQSTALLEQGLEVGYELQQAALRCALLRGRRLERADEDC